MAKEPRDHSAPVRAPSQSRANRMNSAASGYRSVKTLRLDS